MSYTFSKKKPRVIKSIEVTFYKWVLNAMTAPNPMPTTKFDKYRIKNKKMVRDGVLGEGGPNCPCYYPFLG